MRCYSNLIDEKYAEHRDLHSPLRPFDVGINKTILIPTTYPKIQRSQWREG